MNEYGYTPSFVEQEEYQFFKELTKFLKDIQNEGKTEFNYLEEKIQNLNIRKKEIENITEEKIIENFNTEERVLSKKSQWSSTDYDYFLKNHIEREHKKNKNTLELLTNRIDFYQIKINRINIQIATPETDLSNSNTVQKIIYLKELGVIDYLLKEPCFITSTNNLAKVITAITGEKMATIQPYLNALISKTDAENNNPYKSEKTVEKVKNHLINLGYKPK